MYIYSVIHVPALRRSQFCCAMHCSQFTGSATPTVYAASTNARPASRELSCIHRSFMTARAAAIVLSMSCSDRHIQAHQHERLRHATLADQTGGCHARHMP